MKFYFAFVVFICSIISCNTSNNGKNKEKITNDIQPIDEAISKVKIEDSNKVINNKMRQLDDIDIYEGAEIPREVLIDYFSKVMFPDYYSNVFLDSVSQEMNYKALFLTVECLTGETCLEHKIVTINDSIVDSEMMGGSFVGGFESDEYTFRYSNDTIVRVHLHCKFNEEGDTTCTQQGSRRFVINDFGKFIEQE